MFDNTDEGAEVWKCSACGDTGNDFEFCGMETLVWLGRVENCKEPGCDGGEIHNGQELVECEGCEGDGFKIADAPEPCVWCGKIPKCDDCEDRASQ